MNMLFWVIAIATVVQLPGGMAVGRSLDDLSLLSDDLFAELSDRVNKFSKSVSALSKQMLQQQLFVEERIRSDADSGVKQVRYVREGTRNYYSNSHTSAGAVMAIHDHSNNDRTVGMGEFVGVLNGVEFRTRHNDYRLYMPHKTSKVLHEVQNIPFPKVPPEVLNQKTVKAEIEEMRAWFKAWADQDHSVRDYRKYFKPVLCYLEGYWTKVEEEKIDEPFESDRHFVDAKTWDELIDKIRFTSYAGRKDNLENYSYLPRFLGNVTEEGLPEFVQWNYRILCHPISRDLPLNRFRTVEELGPRISSRRTSKQHTDTRAARFQLNPFDTDQWKDKVFRGRFGLLEELMSEIPGQDNYQGSLTDDAFGLTAYSVAPGKENEKLRADRYHSWYRVRAKDAMGISIRRRGFADGSLFMAMNTQPKISGMKIDACDKAGKHCNSINQKWSYAIPLEIIYLTPLSEWNPYDIDYKGDAKGIAKVVEANGRNGGLTEKTAYNGTHSRKFYMTPAEFFSGNENSTDLADTTKNMVGVLDKNGKLRITKATGTRIFFPTIHGINTRLRQRYPIMPVHGEGSQVWKELEALKDVVLKSKTNKYAFTEPLTSDSGTANPEPETKDTKLEMTSSNLKSITPHVHFVFLTAKQVKYVKDGGSVEVVSTEAEAHSHRITVIYKKWKKPFYIAKCDSGKYDTQWRKCKDQHGSNLVIALNQ